MSGFVITDNIFRRSRKLKAKPKFTFVPNLHIMLLCKHQNVNLLVHLELSSDVRYMERDGSR